MNDKRNVYLRVQVDPKTDTAIRKILEIKGQTIQGFLETTIRNFILENLEVIMTNDKGK